MKSLRTRIVLVLGLAGLVAMVAIASLFNQVSGQEPNPGFPPRKLTSIAYEEQVRATAQFINSQPGVPKHRPTREPVPETPPVLMNDTPVPGGTITEADEIFRNLGIHAQNSWYTRRGNTVTRVYAGAITFDPTTEWPVEPKGILFEKQWTDDQLTNQGQIFHTPTNGGAVRIIDANGENLYLQAEDGATFTFNIATGEFK